VSQKNEKGATHPHFAAQKNAKDQVGLLLMKDAARRCCSSWA
jgi:hypothetical protein